MLARTHMIVAVLIVASLGLAVYLLVTPRVVPPELVLLCSPLVRPEPGVWFLCHQQAP